MSGGRLEGSAAGSEAELDTEAVEDIADGLVETHADLTTGTAIGSLGSAHGAVTGTSKIARIHTPAGTAANIYVTNESSAPSGEFLGDVWIPAPDETF